MIARFMHRYALLVIGVWALAAIVGNSLAPRLEQLVTAEDQPFAPIGTTTSVAVQRSAAAFEQPPGDNTGYLIMERDGALTDRDRAFYNDLVPTLRADSRHVIEVVDWWGVPALANVVQSKDRHAVTATIRLAGLVGTSRATEAITAARAIVAQKQPPDGLQVFVTGPGATIMDEFAAVERQTQLITAATIVALLFLLLIVYRSPITAMVPLVSVILALAVAKPLVTVLIDQAVIGVSLFSLGLSIAVVVGAGTGFSIFLIGRYQERRRQNFGPVEALVDAYRGVAPAIVGSTLIVVTPLGALGWLSLASISMFATTGILCSIGVLTVGVATLTLTPALIALAGRANLIKPLQRKRMRRRWQRIGVTVARWPEPILVGGGVLVLILLIALPGVPIGWDEAAATPPWAESNRGYQAADKHFPPNQLLPTVVTIETDHDLRNPAGLTAIERITAAIMELTGVRMVQSASHPAGMVSKQAASEESAGNIGDRLDEFSDRLTSQEAAFTNLEAAAKDVVSALDLLKTATQQGGYGVGQASLAVRLMQTSITKIQSRTSDVLDIFQPLRNFVGAIPQCPQTPVCSAAQKVVHWSDAVVDSSVNLVNKAGKLANGIVQAASTASASGIPSALNDVDQQLPPVRASATKLTEVLNSEGATPIKELPAYLRRLVAVSPSTPGVDLYAARQILTDPKIRTVLGDFVSPNGHATRLIVYGDGHEWGGDGARRAGAIRAAVDEVTNEKGTLKPTAIDLVGVGPATRELQDIVGSDLAALVSITLAVILAIAALLLRSPVAGLVVLGTIATSYVCALGASVMLWQHVLGHSLHWSVPPIAFVLLIAAGSACNLLFALRVREERLAGPRVSIIRACAATGAVVTAAGIVLGTAMLALATSSVLSVAQIGATVGIGLLLDAVIVRAFLLPALMVVLGRWLWWPRQPERLAA
ncbi:RND family transporter [Mycobacterium sp.]|uniref:MMPL/RND family transporter n=1 Tax=Mycobacterium sp. TaxID=1785 RepID=UPI003BAB7688